MFFAKVATFVIAAFLIIGAIASASHRPVADKGGVLHVKKLNEQYEGMEHAIRSMVMDAASLKAHDKAQRAEAKKKARLEKSRPKVNRKRLRHSSKVMLTKSSLRRRIPSRPKQAKRPSTSSTLTVT